MGFGQIFSREATELWSSVHAWLISRSDGGIFLRKMKANRKQVLHLVITSKLYTNNFTETYLRL